MLSARPQPASGDAKSTAESRAQSRHRFTGEDICAVIRDLRTVDNPDRRVQMVVQVVLRHSPDDLEALVLAHAEIERARCSPQVRRQALAQLQPRTLLPASSETIVCTLDTSNVTSLPPPYFAVETDPELSRVANGLGKAAAFRLWLVFHMLNRADSGVGQVDKLAVWTLLPAFGIHITRRYYNALLRRENGRLWALSRDGALLHLRSYETVARRLTALALRQNPDLVVTNTPGQKFKTISVAGSVADFEAACMAAWIDSRRDTGMTQIALDTLAALFGRSPNTIRDWLKRAGVQVEHNYTQYAGTDARVIPSHANRYVTKAGDYRVTWQLSNTYIPKTTPERQHKYTPCRVQHVCEQLVENWFTVHPAGESGTARSSIVGGGVYRTGNLYFAGSDDMRKARKRVYRHLRWHQDYARAHHVFLGFKRSPYAESRGEIGLYECVDPDEHHLTRLHERDYRADYRPHHRCHIESYRAYMSE